AVATGDVIGIAHSDDFLAHKYVLQRVAEALERTHSDAAYGDLDYVSADNPARVIRHWRASEFHPRLLRMGWMPPHPALFLRSDIFRRWGTYDTSFRIAADYDAILRYFT